MWGAGYYSSHHDAAHVEAYLAAKEGAHGAHAEAADDHGAGNAHHADGHNTDAHHTSTHDDQAHATLESHDTGHHELGAHEATDHDAHAKHLAHVKGQLHNKPWSALYIAAFFFMMIALGTLAFYAIQIASQAGWSPVLFRVMEGITAFLPWGLGIVLLIMALGAFGHAHHIFHWMDPDLINPDSDKFDKLIYNKKGWLNPTMWFFRGLIYSTGYIAYRIISRKLSLAQDVATDNKNYKKGFKLAAGFLVFFIYTESMLSWDWIMSVDPHWFSTLFGWYVFASMFVSAITVIALVTIYLKSRGYLPFVNDSHLHDLAKFMFAISIFWTYLWFSQFMLIWYSNIPEEVTYFITRIEDYNLPFFGMLVLNFIFPLLVLINSDYKRIPWLVVIAGIFILFGHYVDIFNMIMPATVGKEWSFGMAEFGGLFFFGGIFMLVVFNYLQKAPLLATGNPLIKESEKFHY
jgi:hypothetical protein